MADRDRLVVLRTHSGRRWSRSSRPAVPAARRRITTCVARSRRSSGGTRTGRSGAAFRLSLGRGGWQRKPSIVGAISGFGSACSRRRRRAGSRSAWRSWTAATSARTKRRRVRPATARRRQSGMTAKRSVARAAASGPRPVSWPKAGGRAVSFALAPGQAHELPIVPGLLGCLPDVPGWVVGDRGLASHAFRQHIWDLGARPAIPPKRNEEPVACPPWIYHNRNRVERLWARLKEWRAVATRYEKTARAFLDVLCMAATMDWLKAIKA